MNDSQEPGTLDAAAQDAMSAIQKLLRGDMSAKEGFKAAREVHRKVRKAERTLRKEPEA